jgi:hypothetical protein
MAYTDDKAVDEYVEKLAERARTVGKLDYTYLAVPIPEPEIFISEEINARVLNIHKYFRYKAALAGIHVVDLITPFSQAGGFALYQHNDGHWSGNGASLAAAVAARYIRDHRLLAPKSEQLPPDTVEPAYEQEFAAFLRRNFRSDMPYAERTCLRPISGIFDRR